MMVKTMPWRRLRLLQKELRRHHLDARLLDKPVRFSDQEADWADWKFSFVNWVCLIEPRYEALLSEAEGSVDVVPDRHQDASL